MNRKVVGILGGMGPEATADLFAKIIAHTPAEAEAEHLHVIIDSNPGIPSRQRAVEGRGPSPLPMMRESGRLLERAGAELILLPCVTAHYFLPELRRALGVPVLSILEETAAAVLRELPRVRKIGLLSTAATARSRLFHDAFSAPGVEILVPRSHDSERTCEIIERIKTLNAGQDRTHLKEGLLPVARGLISRGAEALVAGCTEIPLVLNNRDLPCPIFDTLLILARAAIAESLSR